ncbi:biotin/lipoyl-containing protein [Mycolicibacterium sp.]|uniref:biotin/lipoyl-containing protein n=1 Tax=Mycolicibacterium sp. TaxID=2320850 RepID=UPI003D0CED04
MAQILFPMLSSEDADAEGVVSTWFVADGDSVTEGDLLAEVAVDKVDMEILAPATGTVRILVAENVAVVQEQPIAEID